MVLTIFNKVFTIRWEWLIIAGLLVFLVLQKCSVDSRNARFQNSIDSLTLANQKLDSIKNKKDQTIYTQTVIATNMQAQIKQLAQEKFDLQNKYERKVKDITFFYQAKLRAKLPDSTIVVYKDTTHNIPSDCDSLKRFVVDSMIVVPQHVNLVRLDSNGHKAFSLDADIRKNDLIINNLEFIDSQYIRVDKMKRGFWKFITFKPNSYQVKVLHTSPYMQVLGQNSIIYVPPKKANLFIKAVVAGGLIYLGTLL